MNNVNYEMDRKRYPQNQRGGVLRFIFLGKHNQRIANS